MLSARPFPRAPRRARLLTATVAAMAAAPLVWYLASPLVLTQRVSEMSPAQVVRLDDDFRVTNGPDLYVYRSGATAPRSSAELHDAGAVEVGRLNGSGGGQNYAVPADLDLSQFRSVVVYCRRCTTVFSTAELAP